MAVSYLKQAEVTKADSSKGDVGGTVRDILASLREGREDRARELARDFDDWDGPIIVERETIDAARADLPNEMVDDIVEAHANIRDFAIAQRTSLSNFEIEVSPGLRAGHKLVPVQVSGCYIPAGRFPHIASALMSVTTSKVAGVDTVIAASPARDERGGVHPAILVAADVAGADIILGLGGVQAIGAMAFGLFTGQPADMLVGPGNSFVAEAKRQLFGEVGIDAIAGPTESMIAADRTADALTVATDLVGQAEHGPDSPVWLVSTDEVLAKEVRELVPKLADQLPEPARTSAISAWRDYGEIIIADTREEAAQVCDDYAAEHLQILADDLGWWHGRLRNYGSLFLGENTTVTFGDKSSGPNHILPTMKAARYTGGLNVLKFLKQLTYQELTDEASDHQGELAGRISRYEGMEGHARSADLRVASKKVRDSNDAGSAPATPTVDIDFTAQEPIPANAVARANELMASGNLFRYGETSAGENDAAMLESEFAELMGSAYCVALNSCGAALAATMIAAGVGPGDKVMMNAFTLAPVPGAIAHAGAEPVFVGITPSYHIDMDDLRRAAEASGAKWLLLSHMRGHITDMDALTTLCDELGVSLIEDCAHTMGATWGGKPSGSFGLAACFSNQSFKHANSGEGGLLVTNDEDLAARAILLSGSYMLYEQHGARPGAEVFDRHRFDMPNFSMRMSGLAAALARPQMELLPDRARRWNERYVQLAVGLRSIEGITVPPRDEREGYVASSVQFTVDNPRDMSAFLAKAKDHGVVIKWFGADDPVGFTSRFDHWKYAPEQSLQPTQQVLAGLCDMRIPLSMSSAQADTIVEIIAAALAA